MNTSETKLYPGDSPEPLYVQIRSTLRQRILEGTYVPHQRLPSESELMAAFGVSRITIRQALRDLHNEGLIFSAQGKGSFVSKPKAVQNVQRLEGFGEAMAAQGHEAVARLLSIQERKPPKAAAAAFELQSGDSVVEVKRVRYLNRNPVSLDISYFPTDIGRRLFGCDLSGDIFPMLENLFAISLGAADIGIESTLADDETQHHLNLKAGEAVLRVERLTYSRAGRPIDFEYLSFRGDSFKYQFRVERK
ncbi:GntR family transcriptional regulator [Hydrocarboniclastica marina]|uniref:GntR family transcriptional regulator n=1 Tax=Hydrocarboniclastica marina TaxID=2259620 RepID=A0A4P7XG50_9ALTE|nr:GntR family transcriptional regulator [Hydrocarboniclastica marina]MAL99211.1 GntR family transcriptional regulator [Alteromonadaceae bacterium]QCF25958.1 GntR family transcriptional regulator [Hydrocarboniclastica marina]|tara:strand:+ start:2314 stop:3060 length:747 start_codon:yes stop_codon:yes gene_type:complete